MENWTQADYYGLFALLMLLFAGAIAGAGVCLSRKVMPLRLSAERVNTMHAFYMTGASLSATGRKFNRSRKSLHQVFMRRGLAIRPPT